LLLLRNPATDYPNIRAAAARMLRAGHLHDVLSASYARLIVDEYQDCSVRQHALVLFASQSLPSCVLGDPLQAIFGFGGDDLAHWENDVCKHFPLAGQLSRPWRWINAGTEALGEWLLFARSQLLRGEPLDLQLAPKEVRWIELNGKDDHAKRLAAARVSPPPNGSVLIVGDSRSPDSQRQFASQTPGAVTVEAVDLRDLVAFAGRFDLRAANALQMLAEFAQTVMTNVGAADLLRRVQTIEAGRDRRPATDIEQKALAFKSGPNYGAAAGLMAEIGKQGGVRQHRPAVVRACIRALELCHGEDRLSFADAVVHMREQNRLTGRPLPRRAVGSTLLLKGLEADVSVILDAGKLDPSNLYVAMTRGSRRLIICSESSTLKPKYR
jgi:DNA helicase-2/ATP-dependent DNA helicase PcrA